jgi:hypothetical protein
LAEGVIGGIGGNGICAGGNGGSNAGRWLRSANSMLKDGKVGSGIIAIQLHL